jgi:hypothetical protein
MQCVAKCLVLTVMAGATCCGVATSRATAADKPAGEAWRYVHHNNEWWYWLPEGRWAYWRGGHWNRYAPAATNATQSASEYEGSRTTYYRGAESADEIRPFYGHAGSAWEYRAREAQEVGPFYGHAMPADVFGPSTPAGGEIRPYYGHAVSPR